MATNFPTSLDSLTNPTSTDQLTSPSHADQHANANDAIEALQAKVGVNSSAVTTSLDYKVENLLAVSQSNRNVVINGAMQVAQRGTSTASITTSGYYTADRWVVPMSSLGTWTQSVENDAPTGSGFRKSLKMLCTTADASPAAGDYLLFGQRIEGQNLQQFLKGTASAKQFTLSFWVKSTTTGTYIVELEDIDNTRSVSASYTISAANTWEKKTITFPADTTGALDNDNLNSLTVFWWLGAGTTYTSGTLATTWGSITSANRAVGQTNLAGATSRSWQITGVQLEAGSVATPFEFEDYGTTLAKCQRYYEKSYNDNVNPGTSNAVGPVDAWQERNQQDGAGRYNFFGVVRFKVQKRGAPTMTYYSQAGTTNRATLNRAGNTGTTGFYNLYVATSGDSAADMASYDIGQNNAVVGVIDDGTLSVLDMCMFHFVASAEL